MDPQQLIKDINLKAITALGSVVQDYERGLISRAQAATGCRAIFDTVSGIATPEVFDLVTQASAKFKDAVGVEVNLRPDTRNGKLVYNGTIRYCGLAQVLRFRAVSHHTGSYNDDEPDLIARDKAKL